MQYQVVSGKDVETLTTKMKKYEVSNLGSLTIANSHYYQSFIGVLIPVDPKVIPKVTPVIEDVEVKPKRKPRTKKQPTVKGM